MALKDDYNTGDSLGANDFNTVVAKVNQLSSFATTVTAGETTTLTATSARTQEFTGSANQTLVLPTTGVEAGMQIIAINNSSGTISTQASGSGVVHVLGPGVECMFTALVANPTLPEHWEDSFFGANFAAGKVLNISTTLTLAGTDGTTFTFPPDNDTVATIAATQTLTNKTFGATCVGQVADMSIVAFGAATTRATGTGDFPFGVKLQRAITFSSVTFRVATADASGNLVVELRKNGSAVSGTSTTITAASQVTGGTSTGTWAFSAGDIITVVITAIGTTPGKGLIADIKGLTA